MTFTISSEQVRALAKGSPGAERELKALFPNAFIDPSVVDLRNTYPASFCGLVVNKEAKTVTLELREHGDTLKDGTPSSHGVFLPEHLGVVGGIAWSIEKDSSGVTILIARKVTK